VDQVSDAAEEENTDQPGDQDDERGLEKHGASGAAHHPRDGMGRLRAGGRVQDQERLGGLSGVATAATVLNSATAESRPRSAPAGQ
jgi:hypothetical protein